MAIQYVLAFSLLLLYFAMHSVLAADPVKAWFAARTGRNFRYYRLIYNGLALVLLLFLLRWMSGWEVHDLFAGNIWTKGAALLLLLFGAWLVAGSLWQYDLGEFSGIQQLQQENAAAQHSSLNTSGFNAFVRHPLYLGTILLLVGNFLIFPKPSALLILLSVLVYLPFGIYFEEKKLRRQFGQAYLDYEKRVNCLIPGLW